MTSRQAAVVLVATLLAAGWRLLNAGSGVPNLEIVTAVALGVAVYTQDRRAALVPFAAIVLSDLTLGLGDIAVFTWSAWCITGLAARLTARHVAGGASTSIGFAFASSTWFFLWTNAGVWWMGRGAYYPAGLDGLIQSWVAGVPFYRNMLVGNLVLVPCVVRIFRWMRESESTGSVPSGEAARGSLVLGADPIRLTGSGVR